jgi:hypothetical protein
MLRERCYLLGSGPCEPAKGLHVFDSCAKDTDRCHCGGHQLGYYDSRYIEVHAPMDGEADPQQSLQDLRRLDAAFATLDSLRQSGHEVCFDPKGVKVTLLGVEVARGEGTSADCLRQLANQLK